MEFGHSGNCFQRALPRLVSDAELSGPRLRLLQPEA